MSKKPALQWIARWIAFFAVALFAALATPFEIPNGLDLYSTAEQASVAFGGDVGHYIEYADSIRETGRFDAIQMQRLFPPITSLLIAGVFEIAGRENYLLHLLLISAALWATAFCFLYRALDFIRPSLLRFALINSVWLFHSFTDWGLKTGSFFSESKSMPLFMIALACLVIAIRERRNAYWLGSLIAMTLATYTRVYFETVGHFIFFGVFVAASLNYWQGRRLSKVEREPLIRDWRWSFALVILFSLSLAPWKLLNKHTGNSYAMCPAHYWMTFHNLWMPDDVLPEFIIGGNSACVADPELCQIFRTIREQHSDDMTVSFRVYKTAALATLATRAGRWYGHRASHFWKFWADQPNPSSSISRFRSYFEGYFIIALMLASLILSVKQAFQAGPKRMWAFVVLAFAVQSFIMFTLAGMDYRHSLPVRLFYFAAIPLSFAATPGFAFSWPRLRGMFVASRTA